MSLIDKIDEYLNGGYKWDVYILLHEARDELAKREWVKVGDRLPEIEPRRNIQVAYKDAIGKVFHV